MKLLSRDNYLLLILTTAITPVLWGTTYWTTAELLPPDRPLFSGVLRALPIGVLMALALRTRPTGDWWWRSLVLGTLNIGAFFALLFVAAYRLPGGAASTITALQPLFALGMAAWWLAAKPTRLQLAAAAIGFAGVTLVIGGSTSGLDATGVLAALGAAISMGAGVVLTKRWRPPVSPLKLTAWQLTAGGLVLVPVALAVEGMPPAMDAAAVGGYVYLGVIGTGIAYALWMRGIGRLPVGAVSALTLISPLTATIIDWLALDRSLTASQLAGAVLVLGGVAAAQVGARRTPPAEAGRPRPASPRAARLAHR
jgi:probable blue pigment (indigoidine) exporter